MEYLPHCFSDGSGGFLAAENVTGEPLQCRVLCDETQVSVITWVESTEGDVLQRIEVIDTRSSPSSL